MAPARAAEGDPVTGGILRVSMARAGDGRPGAVRLGREVEPGASHRRVSDLHRPRQHHATLPRRELGAVGRPEDLDVPPAPGREVEQWRRLHRRRRRLQLQALARPQDRLVEHRPVQRPGRGVRHRREGRGRQAQDGPARAGRRRREGRRPHGQAELLQAHPLGAREFLQLSDGDPASRTSRRTARISPRSRSAPGRTPWPSSRSARSAS